MNGSKLFKYEIFRSHEQLQTQVVSRTLGVNRWIWEALLSQVGLTERVRKWETFLPSLHTANAQVGSTPPDLQHQSFTERVCVSVMERLHLAASRYCRLESTAAESGHRSASSDSQTFLLHCTKYNNSFGCNSGLSHLQLWGRWGGGEGVNSSSGT